MLYLGCQGRCGKGVFAEVKLAKKLIIATLAIFHELDSICKESGDDYCNV
jgi:hypothetical protein